MRFGSLALFLIPFLKMHRGQMTNLLAAAILTGPAAFSLLFTGMYPGRRCGDGRDREPDGRAVLDAAVDLVAR